MKRIVSTAVFAVAVAGSAQAAQSEWKNPILEYREYCLPVESVTPVIMGVLDVLRDGRKLSPRQIVTILMQKGINLKTKTEKTPLLAYYAYLVACELKVQRRLGIKKDYKGAGRKAAQEVLHGSSRGYLLKNEISLGELAYSELDFILKKAKELGLLRGIITPPEVLVSIVYNYFTANYFSSEATVKRRAPKIAPAVPLREGRMAAPRIAPAVPSRDGRTVPVIEKDDDVDLELDLTKEQSSQEDTASGEEGKAPVGVGVGVGGEDKNSRWIWTILSYALGANCTKGNRNQ